MYTVTYRSFTGATLTRHFFTLGSAQRAASWAGAPIL